MKKKLPEQLGRAGDIGKAAQVTIRTENQPGPRDLLNRYSHRLFL
jgi:hypothetical protein